MSPFFSLLLPIPLSLSLPELIGMPRREPPRIMMGRRVHDIMHASEPVHAQGTGGALPGRRARRGHPHQGRAPGSAGASGARPVGLRAPGALRAPGEPTRAHRAPRKCAGPRERGGERERDGRLKLKFQTRSRELNNCSAHAHQFFHVKSPSVREIK
jgi:hypothetical protein